MDLHDRKASNVYYVLHIFKLTKITTKVTYTIQGRNHGENLGSTSAMVGRICPPGWDRVKVSENLGATAVAPVAHADTSLPYVN